MADQEEVITTPCSMEKARHINDWLSFLNEAKERRQWGQVVEEAEEYTKYKKYIILFTSIFSQNFTPNEINVG